MQKALLFASLAPITAALATLGAPAAFAQNFASPASVSKSQAILGGAPSRLAAIMAAQGGGASGLDARLTSPSYRAGPMSAALLHPTPYQPTRLAPAPVAIDRPDVFNSVALEVRRTSLDRRWSAVAGSGVGGEAGRLASSLRQSEEYARVEAVNHYVNSRVSFVDDRVRHGVADRWSAAPETLASGRGDCEDFAIAKRAMLRQAGFAERDLYLVVLKDLVRRADHAVLVVRTGGRFLVLDNGTDRLIDSAEIADYRPILTFTAGRAFTHGYRRDSTIPPVRYAMAQTPASPEPAASPMAAAPSANNGTASWGSLASSFMSLMPGPLARALQR